MRADKRTKGIQETMRVPVKIGYELGELTEKRLGEMGARCLGETSDVEYYFDTETFQLASTQTWLSQHKGQWQLILAQVQELTPTSLEETKNSEEDIVPFEQSEEKKSNITDTSPEEGFETDAACIERPDSDCSQSDKRFTAGSENLMSKSQVQSTSSDNISARSFYTELNDQCSIMMYITKRLQLPLTHNEIQNMTMKNFLRVAEIQIYDSWTRSRAVQYSLPGGFSLAVEKKFSISTEASSACLMMDADVLNISSELERMNQLHKELGLKLKASSA